MTIVRAIRSTRRALHRLAVLAIVAAGTIGTAALPGAVTQAGEAPLVAAASDLKFALDEIAQRFAARTGQTPRLVFGSSGNFYRQIAQGAPFELFMSADEDLVLRLAAEGRTRDRGVRYARGRLVLYAPEGSPIRPQDGLAALAPAAADGRLQRLAIANPEHAPYGRAAEQALRNAGVWDALRPRLVLGENVSQAAQFAVSGAAQAGLFAQSLALAPAIGEQGSFVVLPQSMHAPLDQRMVLLKGAGVAAQAFYRYLQHPDARAVLERYGFRLPSRAAEAGEAGTAGNAGTVGEVDAQARDRRGRNAR